MPLVAVTHSIMEILDFFSERVDLVQLATLSTPKRSLISIFRVL